MKKLTGALLAAALVLPATAAPAMAKDHGREGHAHGHDTKAKSYAKAQKKAYKRWAKGQRFDRRYAPYYREVSYRSYGRLYAPPRGYYWARSGHDALLIDRDTLLIAAVISALF